MTRWDVESDQRLRTLDATGLLPGLHDDAFDTYTRLVSKVLDVPVALVSLVNGECQFFPAAVGLDEPWATEAKTPLSMSFCKHVVISDEVLRVTDARTDERVRDNLAVSELSVVAYLGVPLRAPGGEPLGSLCAIDSSPRDWSDDDVDTLVNIADAAATLIVVRTTEQQQRERSAHVSHQLRTPLTAVKLELEDLAGWNEIGDDAKGVLRDAVAAIDRLAVLVDDFVTEAQAAGRPSDTDVDAVALALDVVAGWNERLVPAGRSIALDSDGTATVRGDESTLRFVLDGVIRDVVERTTESIVVRVNVEPAVIRVVVVADGPVTETGRDARDALERVAARVRARLDPSSPVNGHELVFPREG